MTATANAEKVNRLLKVLEFDADRSIMIHETTNRPNIFYAVKRITPGEAKTFVRYTRIPFDSKCLRRSMTIEISPLACGTFSSESD
jgi:superfamily II DNA helicase RecQ